MSRIQGLLIVFAIAVVLAVAQHIEAGGGFDPISGLPAVIGKAFGLFIFPGLLPCIVWAFMKFRITRMPAILGSWVLLQLVFAFLNHVANSSHVG